jgi:hypothetical protein
MKKPLDDGERMAKLVRERSTAQKRRMFKREELTKLNAAVQELEVRLAKLNIHLESLGENARREVLAAQARAGSPPIGCRLCSVLERRDEFNSIERLLNHLRLHHGSEIKVYARDEIQLLRFGTDIPSEDSTLSDFDDNDSDDDSYETHPASPSSGDSSMEAKRKIRLKRNAASARKSRKRKRVQLERWRMMLPTLRFQVESLEGALASHTKAIEPEEYCAEPDVVSAAFALIGCSLSSPRCG